MSEAAVSQRQALKQPGAAGRTAFTVLVAISFCHLLNDMMQSLLPALYPMIKTSYALSFGEIGFLTFTFQVTASLLQPVIGSYTDRTPRPYSLAAGMAFTLVGLLLLAFAGNYGLLLQREGRLSEAEPLLRGALAARLSLYSPDHFMVGYCRVSLAILLHDKGDLAGSESEFRQALAIYDKSLPDNHQYRAALLMHFARLLVDRNKAAEALVESAESVRIWTATSPASNPQTALAHAIHAYALEHLGKSKPAAEELDAAVPVLVKARGTDDAVVRRAQNWLKTADPDAVQTASTSVTVHRP